MTMLGNILRFGRRNLHTIVSTELIKPSSPTPSHLKTYNLTLIDQMLGNNNFIPFLSFYPNTDSCNLHEKTRDLKSSLSQTLKKYYPFAGSYAKVAPAHVDCNDNGVEFIVGSIDTTLSNFLQNSQHEDLNQFFPYGQVWYESNRKSESNQISPLSIQINHFECGGVAIAVSLSHKVADAISCFHFLSDWAKMTQFCSRNPKYAEPPSDPYFISHPYKNNNFSSLSPKGIQDYVTRSFVFPNSKINELKQKVKAMTAECGQPISNPTRADVLTWLLCRCAVKATTKSNYGNFIPTTILPTINIRTKMIEPLPEKSIGNYILMMEIPTKSESELMPGSFIRELQKQKINFKHIRNIEAAYDLFDMYSENVVEEHQKKIYGSYVFTSLCGFGVYDIDFGWGKPAKITFAGKVRNFFILMETPNRDGIEALICLKKKDMDIFQDDPQLLALC